MTPCATQCSLQFCPVPKTRCSQAANHRFTVLNLPCILYDLRFCTNINANLLGIKEDDKRCFQTGPKVILHAQVPNIKFTVAKLLERLVPLVDTAIADHTIKPCLQTLAEDADVDVQFFAQQALVSCEVVSAA